MVKIEAENNERRTGSRPGSSALRLGFAREAADFGLSSVFLRIFPSIHFQASPRASSCLVSSSRMTT